MSKLSSLSFSFIFPVLVIIVIFVTSQSFSTFCFSTSVINRTKWLLDHCHHRSRLFVLFMAAFTVSEAGFTYSLMVG